MPELFPLVTPRCVPPLDPAFRPAVLADAAFRGEAARAGGTPLVFGLERPGGGLSRHETVLLPQDHPLAAANPFFAERCLKFLLWQHGASKVYVGGPASIGAALARAYAPGGTRAFDCQFMGTEVYGQPFAVLSCAPEDVPASREHTRPLGRHLGGCRIGFDLGASDRKVSAVIDGTAVFSEEVVWNPRSFHDPAEHYREILSALRTAAAHLPRVDAIGGSAAGVYVDSEPRVASLFRGVPKERFGDVRLLFQRLRQEFGVPLEVLNDGEVTALAGSMSLGVNAILGIALGSSEAAGYVTRDGHLTDWLNELAFAPIDYAPESPVDEWSGDRGTGAHYLSQQAVFRLAPNAGLALPTAESPAEQLRCAQDALATGHTGAKALWQTLGIYLGYALAHYAQFYDLGHVLVLGRCSSGAGGTLLLEHARTVLATEFPALAGRIALHLPDEQSRRVGQSIAAASLPALPAKKGV